MTNEAKQEAIAAGGAKGPPIASQEERARRVDLANAAARELICQFSALLAYHARRGEVAEAEAARDGVAYAQGVRLCLRDLED